MLPLDLRIDADRPEVEVATRPAHTATMSDTHDANRKDAAMPTPASSAGDDRTLLETGRLTVRRSDPVDEAKDPRSVGGDQPASPSSDGGRRGRTPHCGQCGPGRRWRRAAGLPRRRAPAAATTSWSSCPRRTARSGYRRRVRSSPTTRSPRSPELARSSASAVWPMLDDTRPRIVTTVGSRGGPPTGRQNGRLVAEGGFEPPTKGL